jgi:UPF0716 family protein affecting phage T7 exclusion
MGLKPQEKTMKNIKILMLVIVVALLSAHGAVHITNDMFYTSMKIQGWTDTGDRSPVEDLNLRMM